MAYSPEMRHPVTVAIINYNGRDVLPTALAALGRSKGRPMHTYLLDDASTDGSADWAERQHPDLEVVRFAETGGKPSRLRNWALRNAETPYVLLLDHDISLEPDCLARLVEATKVREDVLGWAPCLVYADKPWFVYARGNDLHYLGIATDSARRRRRRPDEEEEPPFPTFPGGNVMVNRAAALRLGLFDEEYDFGWGEDAELFARGAFEGLDTLLVPGAVARHVERPRGFARAEAQMYNRYRFLLTLYSRRALILLAPALLLFEAGLAAASLAKGLALPYARTLRRVVGERKRLRRLRRRLLARRRRTESEVLVGASFAPAGALADSRLVRAATPLANAIFRAYWSLVRRWL